MRLLKQRDHKKMPWKNGGGTTYEVAAAPEGAALDTFDWRVSMALVEVPGPFSAFPGCDRVLTILSGGPMTLAVGDAPARILDDASTPFAFPADVPTAATAVETALLDLNVMVRRGRATATVTRHRGVNLRISQGTDDGARQSKSPHEVTTLVLAKGGIAAISNQPALMHDGDVLILASSDPLVTISPSVGAVLYEIKITAKHAS
ncbi:MULTISPECIES: HutD family protein [unclassified Chelatococcus]|uniref:HutD/Ves family protein n=1 Tax=unclassified Chelatococcus TaxID=2638111 RepID=UPI001BCAFB57|nr:MULTISPECIES: HutD family protein [unclassified Chelatococcus]MBS7698906.1 HutD family protein [Chelatococcus sp. YT9]MBX3559517.1 HutD family protein [Chelatococcus sp.]